jgi:hypothetical protein
MYDFLILKILKKEIDKKIKNLKNAKKTNQNAQRPETNYS